MEESEVVFTILSCFATLSSPLQMDTQPTGLEAEEMWLAGDLLGCELRWGDGVWGFPL